MTFEFFPFIEKCKQSLLWCVEINLGGGGALLPAWLLCSVRYLLSWEREKEIPGNSITSVRGTSQRSSSFSSSFKNFHNLIPAYISVQVCKPILRLSSNNVDCVMEQYGNGELTVTHVIHQLIPGTIAFLFPQNSLGILHGSIKEIFCLWALKSIFKDLYKSIKKK